MTDQSAAGASHTSPGGQLWEKFWWVAAMAFLAANAWAWSRFGIIPLLRFWAGFFAVLGAVVLVYARRARRLAEESLQWPPVQATILRSEVVEERQTSFNDEPTAAARTMYFYYPEIEYEYEAEGRKWRSNRLLLVRVNFPEPEARFWVEKYPVGAVVTARRHPRKPGLAVLQPGTAGFEQRYRTPFLVGGGFLVFGTALWVVLHGARFR